MSCKVVMIGGGSYTWMPGLTKDLFLQEKLKNSELVLVDIDQEAAETMQKYCSMAADKCGSGWQVKIAELENALQDADFVCISISTGDLPAMANDYNIPEKYGIFHSTGDTVGPGGISRTLRNVPIFVDFAKKMEKLCPDAWMIHVTNPLSQLTRAVCKTSSIKCIGLCHGYQGSLSFLARYFGVDYEDVDALCVGVNHYTWLKNITCKGKPVDDQLSMAGYLKFEEEQNGPIITNTSDDEIEEMAGGERILGRYFSFELFERFGYFPILTASHMAENFPFFLNSNKNVKKHHVRRKGVLPVRQDAKKERRQNILDIISGKKDIGEMKMSREGLSGIVESLHTGHPLHTVAAMPNQGQISNLPNDVVVETLVAVSGSGIFPVVSGPIPNPLTGMMQTIIDEQECAVEAALTGDRKKVLQALFVSPMVQDKDCVEQLADELIAANKEWLPQFK